MTDLSTPFPSFETGNLAGPAIVLLAGFPDSILSGWDVSFLDALKRKYHLVCLCLPGYEVSKPPPAWGHDFNKLSSMMHETITGILGNEPFFLLAHDWGSYMSQVYQRDHPENVKKLCLLDVGQGAPKSLVNTFYIVFYQIWFVWAYILGQTLDVAVGNFVFLLLSLCPSFLLPCPWDKVHRPIKEMSVRLCYPYYHFWKGLLTGTLNPPKFPSCPLLFMYGTRKNAMFHSPGFLKKIENTPGCKSVELDSGHWVTHFQPDKCLAEISEFFEE